MRLKWSHSVRFQDASSGPTFADRSFSISLEEAMGGPIAMFEAGIAIQTM